MDAGWNYQRGCTWGNLANSAGGAHPPLVSIVWRGANYLGLHKNTAKNITKTLVFFLTSHFPFELIQSPVMLLVASASVDASLGTGASEIVLMILESNQLGE